MAHDDEDLKLKLKFLSKRRNHSWREKSDVLENLEKIWEFYLKDVTKDVPLCDPIIKMRKMLAKIKAQQSPT